MTAEKIDMRPGYSYQPMDDTTKAYLKATQYGISKRKNEMMNCDLAVKKQNKKACKLLWTAFLVILVYAVVVFVTGRGWK